MVFSNLNKLDDFHEIANRAGSLHTDTVLARVASVLMRVFPWPAICGRLMGDAFVVFLPKNKDQSRIEHRAARVREMVNEIDVPSFSTEFRLTASIRIATVTGRDHDLALRVAEATVAEAHAAWGDRTVVAGSVEVARSLAGELTACVDRGTWEVWLQPVVCGGDGRIEFSEALARFAGGQGRMVSRADFFMAGRAKGLLERFDRLMLLRVLDLMNSREGVRLSVNVTYETFASESFPDVFLEILREDWHAARRIILEIAPRCLSLPVDFVQHRLERLAAVGVAIALDDFGSGTCRLRHLTQFPLAILKRDELVTGSIDDDPLQREFVRTVVSICRSRGIKTVAEYTRSPEQFARLVEDGVDWFQGKLFGTARPALDLLQTSDLHLARR